MPLLDVLSIVADTLPIVQMALVNRESRQCVAASAAYKEKFAFFLTMNIFSWEDELVTVAFHDILEEFLFQNMETRMIVRRLYGYPMQHVSDIFATRCVIRHCCHLFHYSSIMDMKYDNVVKYVDEARPLIHKLPLKVRELLRVIFNVDEDSFNRHYYGSLDATRFAYLRWLAVNI
jgi:hypothetical protein